MRRSLFSITRALSSSIILLSFGGVALAGKLSSAEFTLIQGIRVLKSGLKEVGDIDGNGVVDLVSLTPTENGSAGSIRVYMMKNKDTHLFNRHITTGKWGFNLPLMKGDTFGTSIAKIGDVNGDGVQDIAVGAPGDKAGAVYILMLTKSGSILKSVKISASSDASLRKQLKKNEGFGTVLNAIQDINGDGVKELSVESTDGSKTLIMLSAKGESISSMKFATGVDPKNLQHRLLAGKIRVMPLRIDGMGYDDENALHDEKVQLSHISARAAQAESDNGVGCFFNSTACACREFASASTCLDTVATEDGQTVCLDRPCHPSYKCDCTGTKLCSRKETTESSYQAVPGTTSTKGLSFCDIRPTTMMRTFVVPGAEVPTAASLSGKGKGSGVWTSTRCSCSKKEKFTKSSTKCMDLARKDGNQDICTVRDCRTAHDMVCDVDGKSTCDRKSTTKDIYVNQGNNSVVREVNCSLVSVTLDAIACTENCPKDAEIPEEFDTSPLR